MNKEEDKLVNAIITLQQTMVKELGKVNLSIKELRTSYMKLDESFNKYAQRNDDRAQNHQTRIVRLEQTRGSSFVAEPKTAYKKTKKKK